MKIIVTLILFPGRSRFSVRSNRACLGSADENRTKDFESGAGTDESNQDERRKFP